MPRSTDLRGGTKRAKYNGPSRPSGTLPRITSILQQRLDAGATGDYFTAGGAINQTQKSAANALMGFLAGSKLLSGFSTMPTMDIAGLEVVVASIEPDKLVDTNFPLDELIKKELQALALTNKTTTEDIDANPPSIKIPTATQHLLPPPPAPTDAEEAASTGPAPAPPADAAAPPVLGLRQTQYEYERDMEHQLITGWTSKHPGIMAYVGDSSHDRSMVALNGIRTVTEPGGNRGTLRRRPPVTGAAGPQ